MNSTIVSHRKKYGKCNGNIIVVKIISYILVLLIFYYTTKVYKKRFSYGDVIHMWNNLIYYNTITMHLI